MTRLQEEVEKILSLGKEYKGSAIEDCMALYMLDRLGLSKQQISDLIRRPKSWITRRVEVAKALTKFSFKELQEGIQDANTVATSDLDR